MPLPALRLKITDTTGIAAQILNPIPTQGNNPWVDGVSYDGKLVNPSSDLYASLNHNPLKNVGIELGAFIAGVQDEKPVEVLISFVDDPTLPGSQQLATSVGPITPWTSNLKSAYLEAFKRWEEVANIRFTEVEQGNSTNIEYYILYQNSTTLGSHQGILEPAPGLPQTSWINSKDYSATTPTNPGSSFIETAIHEIGHGIGLAHPHDRGLDDKNPSPIFPGLNPNGGLGDRFGVFGYGLFGLNHNPYTIMSYNRGLTFDQEYNFLTPPNDTAGHVASPMALDIMAAQLKYGYNTNTKTGDDVYKLTGDSNGLSYWGSIWDAGGIDTIDASDANYNSVINLRAAPMNAWRPQSQEMSEQYNWEALGVTDAKTVQALQVIIDTLNGPGSLLGTSYKFANLAPSIINVPNRIKEQVSNGKWSNQSFGEYFFETINTPDVNSLVNSVKEIVNGFGLIGDFLTKSDLSVRELAASIDVEQKSILQESAANVAGYVSQVLTNQGGFTIAAGVEIENATGSAFDDSIIGNFLSNVLHGELGNDFIQGLQGNDTVYGGLGDDIIDGGIGSDFMAGGLGQNRYISSADGSGDAIVVTSARMKASPGASKIPGTGVISRFDIIEGLDLFDKIYISLDRIEHITTGSISVDGLEGTGIFTNGYLQALYTGGVLTPQQIQTMTYIIQDVAGNDASSFTLNVFNPVVLPAPAPSPAPAPAPAPVLPGGAIELPLGTNTFIEPLATTPLVVIGNSESNLIRTGLANDSVSGGGGNDTVFGGAGNDTVSGGDGDDVIGGGSAGDLMNGNKGNDAVNGGQGDDTVRGGQGRDSLTGGLGTDELNGNFDDDVLTGGLGSDRFVLSRGSDTITDFSFSEGDRIVIAIDPAIEPLLQYQLVQEGSNLLIVRDQGITTLLNVDINAFQAANPIQFF